MIRNQKKALIFLAISGFAAIIFVKTLLKDKPIEESEKPAPMFTAVASAAPERIKGVAWQQELQKCFPSADLKEIDFTNLPIFFDKAASFNSPVIEMERYELKTNEDADLVVQYIPSEEPKNEVRVFNISKEDGLPDRVHEFPNSTAAAAKKLDGALSLGKIMQKNETFRQEGLRGETLEIEKSNNAILKIRYSEPGIEFTCNEIKCKCLTF